MKTTKVKNEAKKSKKTKEVVAYRKSCNVTGIGLSHYVLMGEKKN